MCPFVFVLLSDQSRRGGVLKLGEKWSFIIFLLAVLVHFPKILSSQGLDYSKFSRNEKISL